MWIFDNDSAAVRTQGHEITGARVFVVGAGGAGSAIAAASLAADAASIAVTDVDGERTSRVVTHLDTYWPGRAQLGARLSAVDLAVNATPLGLRADDPLPYDLSYLPANAFVADIIRCLEETRLLRAAVAATARYTTAITWSTRSARSMKSSSAPGQDEPAHWTTFFRKLDVLWTFLTGLAFTRKPRTKPAPSKFVRGPGSIELLGGVRWCCLRPRPLD